MKKLFALLILFLLLAQTARAQEPITKIYLPLITKMTFCPPIQNAWRIVKPQATTNMILNPSGETTGNFAAQGAATVTRSTTYQKYGLYSFNVVSTGNGQGISLTLSTLTNSVHWFTARIRKTIDPPELRFNLGPSSQKPILLEKIDDNWDLWGTAFGATESNGQTTATITQFGPGNGNIYLDGLQIEAQADWTTYCDGTQEGCAWNGAEHASTSSRSALSTAGGIPQDLFEEYRFFVQRVVGSGATTQTLNVDSYALLPGGELNSLKTESRQFSLIGKFITDTEQELHDYRQDLLRTLRMAGPGQPLRLRFNGARAQKEIGVFYQGGLEGDLAAFYQNFEAEGDDTWVEMRKFIEKASIQWLAPDPYWYEVGESAALLDTNDSATFRIVAGRLRSTGQWSALGPPNAAGTYGNINAIAEDAIYVYFGGNFTNFDNIAAADYIVRYNKQTGVYSALGGGLNGIVESLATAPNGDLYIGGQFTNAGGIAAADNLTRWDGSNYNAVGTPVSGAAAISSVLALAFNLSGNLYIGGQFTDWANIAAADNIVMWNGSSYSAVGTGTDSLVMGLAVDKAGNIIVVGAFTSPANYVFSWDGSTATQLGSGVSGGVPEVRAVAVLPNGDIAIGGNFTSPYLNITLWNGASFVGLSSGVNNTVQELRVGFLDGVLYAVGNFSSAGGISLANRAARWNGYAWSHFDIALPGSPVVSDIHPSRYVDPVIKQKYDLYLGFNTTGTGNFAEKTIVENEGNITAFPKIVFDISTSDTAGTMTIESVRNWTTGKELLFNYGLLEGEKLTIDLTPTQKSIISSFFGSRPDAILANSDFGTWALNPGNNDITAFVAYSSTLYGETVLAYLLWRETYDSWD